MKNTFLLSLACFLLLTAHAAQAQYQVGDYVVSGGGNYASGERIIIFTLGQTGFTYASGAENTIEAGFWKVAWISSTIDVAISLFSAECGAEGVLLRWDAASAAVFDGFNIYRGEGRKPERFIRINGAIIPPAGKQEFLDENAGQGKIYTYRIAAVENGIETISSETVVETPPGRVTLYQNYPNPFNPSTNISFYIPSPAAVSLDIFDVAGAKVKTVVKRSMPEGKYSFTWDGANDLGASASSGVYYCRLKAGKKIITGKLVLLR
ncbi:MAG: T9SS type A sorting domain-containing protein [Candidatus Krumholzibacteriota bacterium]|nr:T9SS type A sorting domain-containing protein [Candidatus Krumholzibacteriota bacterium]